MAVWNLDQPWVLEMQRTRVPLEVKQNHMAVLKGLDNQFVRQIFSGYLYWLSQRFCILLGGLTLPLVLGFRFGTFSHTDTQTIVKQTVNVAEI